MIFASSDDLSLPDPLTTPAGSVVSTPAQWLATRRSEILELFRSNVYGRRPIGRPDDLRFQVEDVDPNAMAGRATRKQVDIHFSGPGGTGRITLGVLIPNEVPKPAPGFVLISIKDRDHTDPTREKKSPFWPAERLIERGYAATAFHYSDLDPDEFDDFQDGVHGIYDPKESKRSPDAWGSVAAWAWGASRVMDYFESEPEIDARHIGVVGHSRGGKAALWCGAEDERFALTVSNNSGCTGAALARNRKGESIENINTMFPHWFCQNYKSFNGREDELPVDQHELLALLAPRLLYVASASEDHWADPEGEFLACVHAEPVYRLFGLPGLNTATMPEIQAPLHSGLLGHHIRRGAHDLTEYDWDRFMDFADRHWKPQNS